MSVTGELQVDALSCRSNVSEIRFMDKQDCSAHRWKRFDQGCQNGFPPIERKTILIRLPPYVIQPDQMKHRVITINSMDAVLEFLDTIGREKSTNLLGITRVITIA